MRRLLWGVVLLLAGCHDSSFGEHSRDEAPVPETMTLTQLCAAFKGGTTEVTSDLRVAGRVTTSDRAENFYRTFCIEQDGAAIEVMAGVDHLYTDFPEGTYVTLQLKGYALGRHYGVLQFGRKPASGSSYTTDYIASSRAALDKAVVRTSLEKAVPEPTLRTIAELTPAMCGTLVRLEECVTLRKGWQQGQHGLVISVLWMNRVRRSIPMYGRMPALLKRRCHWGRCTLRGSSSVRRQGFRSLYPEAAR